MLYPIDTTRDRNRHFRWEEIEQTIQSVGLFSVANAAAPRQSSPEALRTLQVQNRGVWLPEGRVNLGRPASGLLALPWGRKVVSATLSHAMRFWEEKNSHVLPPGTSK